MACNQCHARQGPPGTTQQVNYTPITAAATTQQVSYTPITAAATQQVSYTPATTAAMGHCYAPITAATAKPISYTPITAVATKRDPCQPTTPAIATQKFTPFTDPEYDPCQPNMTVAKQQVGYTPIFGREMVAYPCPISGAPPFKDICAPKPLVKEDPCRPSPKITYVAPTDPCCERIRPKECGVETPAATGRKEPCLDPCEAANRLNYGPCADYQQHYHPCIPVPDYDPYAQQVLGATYVVRAPHDPCSAPPKTTSEIYDPCPPPPKGTFAYPPCATTTKTTYATAFNQCGFGPKTMYPAGYDPCTYGLKTSSAIPANQCYVMPGQTTPLDSCVINVANMRQGYVHPTDQCYEPMNDPCAYGNADTYKPPRLPPPEPMKYEVEDPCPRPYPCRPRLPIYCQREYSAQELPNMVPMPQIDSKAAQAREECLVFIHYRKHGSQALRETLLRATNVIKQYHGRILGLSDRVQVEGFPYNEQCCHWTDVGIVLILFQNQFMARRWFLSDSRWSKPDFLCGLGCIKVFSIPLRFVADFDTKRTFLWVEFDDITDNHALQVNYIMPLMALLQQPGIIPGLAVVNEYERNKIDNFKDSWIKPGSQIYLSLLNNLQDWDKMRDQIRRIMCQPNSAARMKVFAFKLNPELSCLCEDPFACKHKDPEPDTSYTDRIC